MPEFIKGIAHIALTVGDMEASLKFYEEALGFEKAFEIHDDNDQPWIVYVWAGGHQFIELFYSQPGQEKTQGGIGHNHMCFAVDDIEAAADNIVRTGHPLDTAPRSGKDHNLQAWTHDPDGNRIELMQLSDQSPQMKFLHGKR